MWYLNQDAYMSGEILITPCTEGLVELMCSTDHRKEADEHRHKMALLSLKWKHKGKVNVSLQQAVEGHEVGRRIGFHILLDNWLTDGGDVISLTRRPSFTSKKIPGTHFC
jgi:hypothetical protein